MVRTSLTRSPSSHSVWGSCLVPIVMATSSQEVSQSKVEHDGPVFCHRTFWVQWQRLSELTGDKKWLGFGVASMLLDLFSHPTRPTSRQLGEPTGSKSCLFFCWSRGYFLFHRDSGKCDCLNLYPIIMSKAPVLSLLTMAIYSEEELSTVPPQNPEWCLRDLLWELPFYSFTYWSGFLGVEPITPKVSGWEQEVFFSQQMLEAAHLAEAQSDCPQSLCWRLAQVLPRDTDTELLSESTTGSQRQWLIANHAGPGPWGETPAQRHDYERQGERGDHGYLPQSFMQLKLAKGLLYADPVLNVKLIDLSNSQCSLLFLLCGFTPASSTSLKRALFF